jgi:adenine deaminase
MCIRDRLVNDLVSFDLHLVIAKGRLLAEDGKWLVELPQAVHPDWALRSVRLPRTLVAADFVLRSPHNSKTMANVIGIIENQAPTRHLRMEVPLVNGEVHPDIEQDLAKVAVVERHRASGKVQVGLVHGFGFKRRCAVATTMAHDCHQMIVVGTDESCMAMAANELSACGGGQVVVLEGQVIGKVELPIGGLMATDRADVVAHKAAGVLEGFRACGCALNNPNMQLSLLGLVVIPDLRISDLGLVDVNRFSFIPVLE